MLIRYSIMFIKRAESLFSSLIIFLSSFCLFILTSCKSLLLELNRKAISVEIDATINSNPLADIFTEVEIVAMISKVSHASTEVVNTLGFFSVLLYDFHLEVGYHFFKNVNIVTEAVFITFL